MKIFIYLYFIIFMLFFTACTSTIKTTSGLKYKFLDYTKHNYSIYIDAVNFQDATEDEIRNISTKPYDGKPVPVKNAKEAAKAGADILDQHYKSWSKTGTVAVSYNNVAGAWIIHGQMNRQSEANGIGVVVIDAETGEVLCLTFDNSSS